MCMCAAAMVGAWSVTRPPPSWRTSRHRSQRRPHIRCTNTSNMLQQAPYRAPFYLFNGHLQTLWPVWRSLRQPPICWPRERWNTPDGDFIDVDCISTGCENAPVVILFHGLEGNSQSHYARSMATRLQQIGWTGFVPHFRGCSGELNRLPRAYHSGDSTEIDWILRQFRERMPNRMIFAAGVSLGGNALMKWLGEQGLAASKVINAAAAVSPPMNVAACGAWLDQRANRQVYTQHFLRTMKQQSEARLRQFPNLFDATRMRTATTLREFDDTVTAPLHGFAGVEDYWQRASLTAQQNEELRDLNANLELKVMERTVELRKAHEKLKTSFLTSIKVFANLIELRGSNLAGHSRRVADLSRKIANRMQLSPARLEPRNSMRLANTLIEVRKLVFSFSCALRSSTVRAMTLSSRLAFRSRNSSFCRAVSS